MAEYYLGLRQAHIGFAILSVSLFLLRGGLMLAKWPHLHSGWLRYPSYVFDTLLLTSALMLTTVTRQFPFSNDWLTVKVALLLVYIMLGSIALKRGRTHCIRVVAFVAALATVAWLVSVARTHHPLGLLAGFLG